MRNFTQYTLRCCCSMSSGTKLTSLGTLWYAWIPWVASFATKAAHLIFSQGGAVVSAFTATFPHLVADNVTLLASVGMLEVNVSCPRLFVILIRI